MKIISTLLILLINFSLYAQNGLNTPTKDFTFSMNTKFILKMIPSDNDVTEFSVVEIEEYNKIIEPWNYSKLFKNKGEKDTIEFYFCLETSNEKQNPNTVLIMRSYSDYSYKFKTEIQTEENGEFKEIFNVGTHTNSITSDRWAKKTYKIRISNFERIK